MERSIAGGSLAHLSLSNQIEAQKSRFISSNLHATIGVALIAIGLIVISKESAFPGWYALLPTSGAALIIFAGTSAWINRTILSNGFLVWFGLISYPLYLWHWTLLSYAYISGFESSRTIRAVIVFVSILLSWLTYKYVEKPIRFSVRDNFLVKCLIFLMLIVCVISIIYLNIFRIHPNGSTLTKLFVAKNSNNMPKLFGDNSCLKYKQEQTSEMFIRNGCVKIKDPNRHTLLLIGDSHSGSLSLGLRPLLEKENINILQVSTGWCEAVTNDDSDRRCLDINNMVMEKIELLKPDTIIINSHWVGASKPPYFRGNGDYILFLLNYLKKLQIKGVKEIFIVGQIPTWDYSLPDLLIRKYVRRGLPIPSRTFDGVSSESLKMDDLMKSISYPKGIVYLSVRDVLCDELGCLTSIGPDLEKDLVVWDYGHLTQSASEFLSRRLFVDSKLIKSF